MFYRWTFIFRNSHNDAAENFIRSRSVSEPEINFGLIKPQTVYAWKF